MPIFTATCSVHPTGGFVRCNTPVYIAIPNCKGKVDVKFEFDYTLYSDAFDDEQLKMAKQVGEYLMTYDEQLGDSYSKRLDELARTYSSRGGQF